ncbi:MAG: sigma-70 family RNA polymerase sigma factor [Phycisphaeraceae bacterium]|nr:sigma-70 family RNA polymerase sigma factor [Phycisphaeraceae bacterium]
MEPAAPILATRTTTRLLDALVDHSNAEVWSALDARYRPIIAALARRLGLRHTDAEEVAQQTMTEFVRAYRDGRYDRSKGRLSSWILGIAHNTVRHAMRDRKRATGSAAARADDLPDTPDEGSIRSIWSEERDRAILDQALRVLRDDSSVDDRTLRAFELVGLRAVPAAQAAAQCGMSVDQVYVAKSRITSRLKTLVQQLTEAFEEDA